jgi:uncharacterized protein
VRVFLDTNVLISALSARGLCADLVRVVLREHQMIISERVLQELERVLVDKFEVSGDALAHAVDVVISGEVVLDPPETGDYKIGDSDDARILAAAIAADADVLITGDRDLLSVADQVEEIAILSPRQFWEMLRSEGGS